MSYGLQQKHGQRIVLESGPALGSPMPASDSHSRWAANYTAHPNSCCIHASNPAQQAAISLFSLHADSVLQLVLKHGITSTLLGHDSRH